MLSVNFIQLAHESVQQCLLFSGGIVLCAVVPLSTHHFGASLSVVGYFPSSSPSNRSWSSSLVLCFPASSRYLMRGCSLPSTVPVHKIPQTWGNSKKAVHSIYLSIINRTTSKAKRFPNEWIFLLAIAPVPAFEVSYPSQTFPMERRLISSSPGKWRSSTGGVTLGFSAQPEKSRVQSWTWLLLKTSKSFINLRVRSYKDAFDSFRCSFCWAQCSFFCWIERDQDQHLLLQSGFSFCAPEITKANQTIALKRSRKRTGRPQGFAVALRVH